MADVKRRGMRVNAASSSSRNRFGKKTMPKRVLALPDLEHAKTAELDTPV
jgi:hypothetical protein